MVNSWRACLYFSRSDFPRMTLRRKFECREILFIFSNKWNCDVLNAIIFSLCYTKLIVTSSNCGLPCFVFLIRVTYNINPWWIIDCQWPSQHLNVERRYSNGISVCPLCNYGRPLHPSKDWKVSPATLSYCLSTQTTAYISRKTTWDTDFHWACVACTQQKMKASQRAKQLFLIWTFQERQARYGSARLIKLCCSLHFHENSVF